MKDKAQAAGFEELPHTADWAMRVWAEDLPSLFVQAARGLNALSGARLAHGPLIHRAFTDEAADVEDLLVAFLSELVFLQEQENLGFTEFDVRLEKVQLSVQMQGALLQELEKPIKAVTYHNLRIMKTENGYEVQVVFDV